MDAQVLAGMSFKDLETLASKLRKEGEQGVPSSRGREDGKRARMDVEAYRAALAAHLNIDLQGLQAAGRVGAAARSDAHAKAMLDRIDEHLEIFEELPKQKAADDNERELAKWIHNVTTGQNELSDEHRARFDALVNRSAQQKQTAQDRVLDVKAFVKEHGRMPHSDRPDASQQERKLALWIGHV